MNEEGTQEDTKSQSNSDELTPGAVLAFGLALNVLATISQYIQWRLETAKSKIK